MAAVPIKSPPMIAEIGVKFSILLDIYPVFNEIPVGS
jgi:hypothetical protein